MGKWLQVVEIVKVIVGGVERLRVIVSDSIFQPNFKRKAQTCRAFVNLKITLELLINGRFRVHQQCSNVFDLLLCQNAAMSKTRHIGARRKRFRV